MLLNIDFQLIMFKGRKINKISAVNDFGKKGLKAVEFLTNQLTYNIKDKEFIITALIKIINTNTIKNDVLDQILLTLVKTMEYNENKLNLLIVETLFKTFHSSKYLLNSNILKKSLSSLIAILKIKLQNIPDTITINVKVNLNDGRWECVEGGCNANGGSALIYKNTSTGATVSSVDGSCSATESEVIPNDDYKFSKDIIDKLEMLLKEFNVRE